MKITGFNGQGDGVYPLNIDPSARFHQLQITVRDSGGDVAAPAAGQFECKVKTPGADDYVNPGATSNDWGESLTFDLNDDTRWLRRVRELHASSLQVEISALTAGYTVDLTVASS